MRIMPLSPTDLEEMDQGAAACIDKLRRLLSIIIRIEQRMRPTPLSPTGLEEMDQRVAAALDQFLRLLSIIIRIE